MIKVYHSAPMPKTLEAIHRAIVRCEACPRLRLHCQEVAKVRRRAYASETYWGRPIPGFGDPRARLVLVGLAPAAHGANRTGRIFTGDRSGDWLYRALHKAGFANQPQAKGREDGLKLRDAYITCVAKCAPPLNKPTPAEIARCRDQFLIEELRAMAKARVFLCLGGIALAGFWDVWKALEPRSTKNPRPKFGHGLRHELPGGRHLLLSYHPSQQNTFTGRLTETMFDSVFTQARMLLGSR